MINTMLLDCIYNVCMALHGSMLYKKFKKEEEDDEEFAQM